MAAHVPRVFRFVLHPRASVNGPLWSAMSSRLPGRDAPPPRRRICHTPTLASTRSTATDSQLRAPRREAVARRQNLAQPPRVRCGDDGRLRRNVAEQLGHCPSGRGEAAFIPACTVDAARVVAWIDACEIVSIACGSPREAHDLERRGGRKESPRFRPPRPYTMLWDVTWSDVTMTLDDHKSKVLAEQLSWWLWWLTDWRSRARNGTSAST